MRGMRLGLMSKLSLAATVAALIVGVIFLIPPKLASDDAANCRAEGDAFRSLTTADDPAPLSEITFIDGDGNDVRLADLAPGGAVVNFWATWCAPCVREMPELDRLRAQLEDEGITVVAISMDRGGAEAVQTFYEKTGIRHLPVILASSGAAVRGLGIRGLPTTLIVDADHRERARIVGIHHYDTDETRAYLRRCIGSP